MRLCLVVDGDVVIDGEWLEERHLTAALLTAAQFLANLGVVKGSRVIKELDENVRAQCQYVRGLS